MAEAKLNWAEATVKKGKLAVPLTGDVPKGFKGHFDTTVKLLGHGDWGKVEIKKKVVQVGGVDGGDADNVRFYLEGLVEQANSAVAAEQEKKARKKGKGAEGSDDDAQPEGPDAELTERFRSFASQDAEEDAEEGAEEGAEGDPSGSRKN